LAGAKLAMLLIEPQDTSFGEGLTRELEYAKKRLVRLLKGNVERVVRSEQITTLYHKT